MSHYANVRWSWYHGVISRVDCEQLLAENAQDGAFLVRSSETVKGAHVLSVWYQSRIIHYRIITDDDNMLILETNRQGSGRCFQNLGELVAHYQGSKHGLCTSLLHPIEPKDDCDDDDSDDDTENVPMSGTTSTDSVVATFLLHSLEGVHTKGVTPEYVSIVKEYLRTGVKKDIEDISLGEPLVNLKQLFQERVTRISSELGILQSQLRVLQAVFDRAIGAKDLCTGAEKLTDNDDSYDSLPSKLRECSSVMESLQQTASVACKDLAVHVMGTQGIQSRTTSISMASRPNFQKPVHSPVKEKRNSRMDDTCYFDVTLEAAGGFQLSKRTLKVNMLEGTLSIIKGGDEASAQVYHHVQVKQLISSRSKERKLGLLLDGQSSRKDINFETLKAREHFCQIIRLMKKTHQKGEESQDSITIFVGTFNMGDSSFPPDIESWYGCHGSGITMQPGQSTAHDIYAIGTQESPSDKDLSGKVKSCLKKLHNIDYEKVGMQSLWKIKLMVFVKPEHANKISHVQGGQVRTGIGNTLGNKGAVGISFTFANTSLCFINSHLASGNEKCARRNQNYHDILKGLSSLKQARQISTFNITHQFHHLFWFGDLNYRIDLPSANIVDHAKEKRYELLLLEDQLMREKKSGNIFADFREEVINFPPTYRYYRGRRTVDDYDVLKPKGGNKFLPRKSGLYEVSPQAAALQVRVNVPSYCDRVLWKSYPGTRIRCLSYGCTSDIMTSDHSPVFATFQISNIAPYVAPTTGPNLSLTSKAEIKFNRCSASILTTSKTQFYLEFYSSCFEGVHRSSPNSLWKDPIGSTLRPSWEVEEMPKQIFPVISDQKYLEMQHVLISIRSSENDELYAECVLTLSGFINSSPLRHSVTLTHQGKVVGDMEIFYHGYMPGLKDKTKPEGSYIDMEDEFIYTEVESLQAAYTDKIHELSQNKKTTSDVIDMVRVSKQTSTDDNMLHANGVHRSKPTPLSRKHVTSESSSSPTPSQSRAQFSEHTSISSFTRSAPLSPQLPPVSPQPLSYSYNMPSSSQSRTPPLPPKPQIQPRAAPRPQSRNVRSLLIKHNLGHFADILIANGYDDLRFIKETTDDELKDVGVNLPEDRALLLKAFEEGFS